MSTLRTNNIANVAGTQSTDVLNVINGSAKAWVNFNGTGTVAIRAAYNVSSITDNGVGDYTVNFTTAMPDANYAAFASSSRDASTAQVGTFTTNTSASSVRIAELGGNSFFDSVNMSASVFR